MMDRAEKIGLGAATAGHILLFGLLSVGFLATPNPIALDRPPVEVQFVDEVALEATTPSPSEQAPATSVAPELGAPEESTPAPPEPAPPEPVPEQPRPTPPAPAPRPAAKVTPPVPKAAPPKPAPKRPAPAPKEVARGSRLGPDFLKGITDKASPTRNTTALNAAIGPAQKAALAAELIRQVKPHWSPPSGAEVEKLRVTIIANLAEDGSIVGNLRVVGPTGVTPSNRAQASVFVERATNAVRRAAPFKLPKELYPAWKRIEPQLYEGL